MRDSMDTYNVAHLVEQSTYNRCVVGSIPIIVACFATNNVKYQVGKGQVSLSQVRKAQERKYNRNPESSCGISCHLATTGCLITNNGKV